MEGWVEASVFATIGVSYVVVVIGIPFADNQVFSVWVSPFLVPLHISWALLTKRTDSQQVSRSSELSEKDRDELSASESVGPEFIR